ncbi:MAG TPA: proline--tRNA ligase [Solirubrobacteraceae bacterium]|nr:proline--tRNA ligase [Solirubrobacteraceae bacterium]
MTRLSEYLLPTEKQAPADAEAISHKLMVRAGLIRQIGAGMWSWLPAGWRVHQRAVQIIREEMDAIGGQEMLMPVLQPAEPWRKSGRYKIEELFKLQDRKGSDLVLAMTHEEAVTLHVAQTVRSYRDLPLILYHFQVKERDEPRPRAGVLRTREFIMKDAYTFDRDAAGMDERYELHVGAYDRIMERTGLRFYRVEADVGMMGGLGAHEYMAPCPAGENEIALAPGYAANVEVASATPQPVQLPPAGDSPQEVATPGLTTVAEVAGALDVPQGALLKAYPVVRADDERMVLVLLRGDHRVNEIKLARALGVASRPAHPEEIARRLGPVGFIGPVGLDGSVEILLDEAALPATGANAGMVAGSTALAASGGGGARGGAADTDGGYVTGANRPDAHLRGVVPGRDFPFTPVDVRAVCAGDTVGGVGGHPITIEPAIEVGNIFKLGTRYSEPLGASYLDESGRERPIWMGCYGIGPARIAAAAVEQYADEHGIAWPRALAPFAVHLVAVGKAGEPARVAAEQLYATLRAGGVDVLYDDREAGPGEKFADAELLGCPLRLTVGRRSLESGEIEVQVRRGRGEAPGLPLGGEPAELIGALDELCQTLP